MVFVEESITDHLDYLIPILNGIFMETDEQKEIKEKVKSILRLIGRYTSPTAFEPICSNIIDLKTTDNEELAICGLTTFKCVLEGYFEALPPEEGLLDKAALVKKLLGKLGGNEFLSSVTKYMITSYSELIKTILEFVYSKAHTSEKEEIFKEFRGNIVRAALTSLSIPLFILLTDNSPELNYKLIKNSIEKWSKIGKDAEAQWFLQFLDEAQKTDFQGLINEIRPEDASVVSQNSNDLLVNCTLACFFLLRGNHEGYKESMKIYEAIAVEKETFMKTTINLNSFMNFYVCLGLS